MIEVIQISRGGSGGVTGAKILAKAAMLEGMDSQAIPKYGSERSGAAVEAYIRFDTKPIRIHSPVYKAQHAIIFEEVFLSRIDVENVDKNGVIIINAKEIPESLKGTGRKIALVDATRISQELGLIMSGYTLINGTMLGAFVKGTKIVGLDSIAQAMVETWGERIAPKNAEAAKRAFEETKVIEA
jgi:pyruvate ferredoxin oxidoreductase gamma subunit